MRRTRSRSIVSTLLLLAAVSIHATAQERPYAPAVSPASNEPDRARLSIRRPADVDITPFAAEPRLANPVAFTIDERGRFYVVETFRLGAGVTDNRSHMYWLDDDLAARTVADRERMTRKWLGKEADSYAVEHDRIRRIEDRDGDHRADHDTIYADGFRDLASGIGSGVLARKGDVFFACIPDLWRLRDTNGDGVADVRESLSTGYGVHVSFIGHDLHGLIMGPDGRLYFSIGDRGLNVVTREGKTLAVPDTGSVLRCEPDGSGLEVFASGLRNPQELAFNDLGDLFTVDNNSDSGDRARVVHLVDGGDSGWRIGYQYIEAPASRGPWNVEKLWHPAPDNTASYLLPPLLNLSDGPSGLTFDPGVTLLPDRYKGHFLLADFRGGAAQSGIRAFAVEPKGASYRVTDPSQFVWSVLATDVDFGPDGALYISDWVDGWDKTGKGRIWRVADPKKEGNPAVKEVQSLLSADLENAPPTDLAALLGHADRRVRLAAESAMVDRALKKGSWRSSDYGTIASVALDKRDRPARLHAIWAIGRLARRGEVDGPPLLALATDPDTEIRAHAARLLGEIGWTGRGNRPAREVVVSTLKSLLGDDGPRVQFFAAEALGRLADPSAVGDLINALGRNDDRDPYLRHAASLALARIGDVSMLDGAARVPSRAVRLGALLALRRLGRPEVAVSLADSDRSIVLEAARAIYDDQPVSGPAMASLAALASSPTLEAPLLRRVVNANARLGGPGRAEALVRLALRGDLPASGRVEVLEILGDWAKPSGKDRVTGLWRPYPARPAAEAATAVGAHLSELLASGKDGNPPDVRRAAIETIGALGLGAAVPRLVAIVADPAEAAEARVEALKAIERIGDPRLSEAVDTAVASTDATVRREGQRLLALTSPAKAVPLLANVLTSGSIRERQGTLAALAKLGRPEADALIAAHLKANDLPAEVELDLIEAAESRSSVAEVRAALDARTASASKSDPLAGFRSILVGGDARKGKQIFDTNTEVYCLRCHKVRGHGGEVGPELTGIGAKQTREYLATSIVHPNAAIAQGFETVVVATADGRVVSGVFKSEDDKVLHLISVDNMPLEIPKSEIEERKRGPSAMPEDIVKKLKKSDLRDLVEFLANLR